MDTNVTFTRQGFLRGFGASLPIALGVFVYGLVFGMLARKAGISLPESMLMSGVVFAGASQIIVLDLWGPELPVAAIVATTLVVNLRHILMGASIAPWYAHLSAGRAYGSVFFMVDESWALSMERLARGERDLAFLPGSGFAVWVSWMTATILGQTVVAALGDPAGWGLDFAFTAVFLALLTGFYRSRADLIPWAVAALVAVLCERLVPGKWYILAGGIAGSLVGSRPGARHGR